MGTRSSRAAAMVATATVRRVVPAQGCCRAAAAAAAVGPLRRVGNAGLLLLGLLLLGLLLLGLLLLGCRARCSPREGWARGCLAGYILGPAPHADWMAAWEADAGRKAAAKLAQHPINGQVAMFQRQRLNALPLHAQACRRW
jgi:hypothetical protein